MRRIYTHPEKINGIGLLPVEKLINLTNLIGKKDDYKIENESDLIESQMSKLSSNAIKRIKDEVNFAKNKISKEGVSDIAAYKMKTIQDAIKDKADIYKISKSFFNVAKLISRNVPSNLLKLNKISYFLFDDKEYEGAYVEVIDLEEKYKFSEKSSAIRVCLAPKKYTISGMKYALMIFFKEIVDINNFEITTDSVAKIKTDYEDFSSFDNILISDENMNSATREILTGLINSIIYLNSKDPDIEALKPIKLYSNKSLHKMEESKKSSLTTFPIKLINWAFHDRTYSVDKAYVRAHLRWQPCGPERKEVKLIWVKEHERYYGGNK